jgi:UPF0755 protein
MKILISFFLAAGVFIAAGAGLSYYLYIDFERKSASNKDQVVIYEIKSGDSFRKVSLDLQTQGLIRNADFFNIYSRVTGNRSKIKAGEYELRTNMTPPQILEVITSGKSIKRPFTVAEGLNIWEIASLVESKGLGTRQEFLALIQNRELIESLLGPDALAENIRSLEGYLFPETYLLTKYMGAQDLVLQMVRKFLQVWSDVAQNYPNPKLKLTRHERVTLASLVEKETGASHERGLVSSVFHNRIHKGMKLQTDPSILYGLSVLSNKQILSISKSDILRETPYNTYVIKGLPPGPVANPGRDALVASFSPKDSDYLFFVSRNDGTSVFSVEYKDHKSAVQKYQVDPQGRQGKSWRDLNKEVNKQNSSN